MSEGSRADYAPSITPGAVAAASEGALIAAVDTDSPAERAGLAPNMTILAVDGQSLADSIDWLWLTDGSQVELTLSDQTTRQLQREPGETWGLSFADPLFGSALKTCCNSCSFCFMAQLPKGMRPSLYIRDDDYRLSFLQGNFVTLTNASDADLQRIIDHHLSPLHVSLHAIDPALRQQLIGRHAARGIEALEQLLAAGIDIHVQIVLLPGLNDGAQLDTTLAWIEQRPRIRSVGIVPYGFTRKAALKSSFTSQAARDLVAQLLPFQKRSLAAEDRVRYQLADEFFLTANLPVPPARYYDDFPQYEDGIGMLCSFIDCWGAEAEVEPEADAEADAEAEVAGMTKGTVPFVMPFVMSFSSPVLVTGTAFAPTLKRLTQGMGAKVVAVRNNFFGGNVNVAGLLTAEDIIAQLKERDLPPKATILIPDVLLNADGLTLDNRRPDDLAQALNHPVVVVPC